MNKPLILLLALLIFLSGCSSPHSPSSAHSLPQPERIETMDALMELVNRRHEAIHKPQILFEDYIPHSSDEISDLFSSAGAKKYDGASLLTPEQLQQDIDFLFTLFRSTYGPYYYFGGDAVFQTAKNAILAQCSAKETLRADELADLLVEHLQFICDAHFTINGTRFAEPVKAHIYNQGSAYLKAEESFVTADGQKIVTAIGDAPPENLLRLSISPAGEVVYYPVVFLENGVIPAPLAVEYSDGSTETLLASEWRSGYEKSDTQLELRACQSIPVLFCRNMYFDQAPGGENGQIFLRYAEHLRQSPVAMVDLRSNSGGNAILPLKWLSAFAGRQVTTNSVAIQRWREEEIVAYGRDTQNQYYVPIEELQKYDGITPLNNQYVKTGDLPDNFVANDSLLIILTGKGTASAAEIFVDAASNVKNTLIIGLNTSGMMRSNAYRTVRLPQSGIAIQFGNKLTIFAEGSFQEYVGFFPDLWVNEAEAEKLAAKLVHNLTQ